MARQFLALILRSLRRPKTIITCSCLGLLFTIAYLSYFPFPIYPPDFASSNWSGPSARLKAHLSDSFSSLSNQLFKPKTNQTHPSAHQIPNKEFNQILVARFEPYFKAWLDRPVLSAEEALRLNQLSCPILDNQTAPDQITDFGDRWDKLSSESIRHHKSSLVSALKKFFNQSVSSPEGDTVDRDTLKPLREDENWLGNRQKGIVVTGGNKDTMIRLMVMLRILRKRLHSLLPVELFMFPDEFGQISSQVKAELDSLGAITIKTLPYKKAPGAWKNFHIKGASIIHSTFTQVLYLDSDNIPLTNPEYLFDSDIFKQYGVVLWPDISKDGPRNPIWRITGSNCIPQDWQVDSGQILLDKRAQHGLVFAAILVAAQMQLDHQFWFTMSNGDKDTFRYALYALQLPWTRAPHWVSSGGAYDTDTRFCGHTMVHYSLSAADWALAYPSVALSSLPEDQSDHAPPLFAHANLLKYTNGRFQRGSTWASFRRLVPRDEVSLQNLNITNQVRTAVPKRFGGMCVEYTVVGHGFGDRLLPPTREEPLTIVDERWADAWGGALKEFEEAYWQEGGI